MENETYKKIYNKQELLNISIYDLLIEYDGKFYKTNEGQEFWTEKNEQISKKYNLNRNGFELIPEINFDAWFIKNNGDIYEMFNNEQSLNEIKDVEILKKTDKLIEFEIPFFIYIGLLEIHKSKDFNIYYENGDVYVLETLIRCSNCFTIIFKQI